MQIHGPLGISQSRRMLDIIDLPRICITSASDKFTTPTSSTRTKAETTSPAILLSRPLLPTRNLSVEKITTKLPPQPVTFSQASTRTRTPSFSRRDPSALISSVHPKIAKMAVLSRNDFVKKSPPQSTSFLPVEYLTPTNHARAASFSRTLRSKSLIPGSPARSRSGSTSLLPKESGTISSKFSSSARPVTAKPLLPISSVARALSPRPCAHGCADRRPSPARNIRVSCATGTATTFTGLRPRQINPLTMGESQLGGKYERNLKKFYSWCQHCKRVQRTEQQDPIRGLFAGGTSKQTNPNPPAKRTATGAIPAQVRQQSFQNKQQTFGLFSFDSSDLPLKPSLQMGLLHPHGFSGEDSDGSNRPKSAKIAPVTEPVQFGKAKSASLFNFDDALSLTPDQVDMTWMYDPLDSEDDCCYNIDVETMSICSDSSIAIMAITCDTKLKDHSKNSCSIRVQVTNQYLGFDGAQCIAMDDDDQMGKAPLRKAYSSNK